MYDDLNLDKDRLMEIEYHEKRAIELRKEMGMYVVFYLPEDNPCIKDRLIRDNRRLEFNERMNGTDYRSTYFVTKVEPYGSISNILSQEEMNSIGATHFMRFHKVETLFERPQPIPRTTGQPKEKIIKR